MQLWGSLHTLPLEFGLFLHGWRRCVCREAQVTLIELNEETNEIRAKQQREATHHKAKTQTSKTTTNPNKQKPG